VKIRVLVVDDSATARELVVQILNSDSELQVIGTVKNGFEAFEFVQHAKPDAITMDLHMPRMGGIEATRKIMQTCPTPIIIVSGSLEKDEVKYTFLALEAGALAVVHRPPGVEHLEHEQKARELISMVKLMSEIKVVKRWAPSNKTSLGNMPLSGSQQIQVVVMGASTGGPPALRTILEKLPANFPVPILIVQHITYGFLEGFAEWLNQSSSLPVRIAKQGEKALPGNVYLAPDDCHTKISPDKRIELEKGGAENGHLPSVSSLFKSAAESFGSNAIGVILTGMGKDGARELKLMKEKGGVTIAQDEETSAVYGMPGEAEKIGGAAYVLPLSVISQVLSDLVLGSDLRIKGTQSA
jgi:two-component system chemotaxis response regulator CheB